MNILSITIILSLLISFSYEALIGIDFGCDLIKVAIVKPGFPFETVTDFNSRRASSSSISIYNGERLFGDDSLNLATRKPDHTVQYMKALISKKLPLDEDSVYNYLKLPYKIVNNDRGSLDIILAESYFNNTQYPLEFFLSMLFGHIKEFSSVFGKDDIRDVVISVPTYFTIIHKLIIQSSLDISELNLLSYIEDNTSAGLQYGLDKIFENKTHTIMIVNIGSANVQLTIVEYITKMEKDLPIRNIKVIGKETDENFGSFYVDKMIIDRYIQHFRKLNPKVDITENTKSYSKMRSSARSVKKILSANDFMPVSIESLYDEKDFRMPSISRAEVFVDSNYIKQKFSKMITNILKKTGKTIDDLDYIELIGGGTRIPKFQELIKEVTGKSELSFHINAEEAVALGSTFRGANCSKAFRVRNIILEDFIEYEVEIEIVNAGK